MENGCCSGKNGCCTEKTENRQVTIDFLYLDLSVCTRCQGTEAALDEALSDVETVLKAAGVDVLVNRINVASKELAIAHRFESSPTIRVNGKDIDVDIRESLCESCGDLCGDNVDCRVWTYQGREYTVPPKALIINAILSEVYGAQTAKPRDYRLPENLETYFNAMAGKEERAEKP